MKSNLLNVYSGANAIKDYLNPDSAYVPLVELPPALNPYHSEGVRIYLKLMNALPLANVKSLPAFNMLMEAKRSGELEGITKIVENSSGNTVYSLAVLGRLFGINRTKAFVSNEVSPGKLQLLRFFGIEIAVNQEPICPDPNDAESGIYLAKNEGEKKATYNPGQYDNLANPAAHECWTGPQIWDQTEGAITILCSGLGTTGTLFGTAKYLKSKSKHLTAVAVVRKPNNPVPGVRTRNLLSQIAFDWQGVTDILEEVVTKDAYERSLMLCRRGLLVGPSSGFALQGLLQFLRSAKKNKILNKFRNKQHEICAVCVCPDSPFPYIEEYFTHLDASKFPRIVNESLLGNIEAKNNVMEDDGYADVDMESRALFKRVYSESAEAIRKKLRQGKPILLRSNARLIDLRGEHEYMDHHLPGSERIGYLDFLKGAKRNSKKWKGQQVYLICGRGNRSRSAATLLRKYGIEAYSLAGGTIEWSAQGLPRQQPESCYVRYEA